MLKFDILRKKGGGIGKTHVFSFTDLRKYWEYWMHNLVSMEDISGIPHSISHPISDFKGLFEKDWTFVEITKILRVIVASANKF